MPDAKWCGTPDGWLVVKRCHDEVTPFQRRVGGRVKKDDEPTVVRGFAVLHRSGDSHMAIWHVAYGDRQAKNVNAVVLDLEDPGADEALGSLTWRQILTTTPGTGLPEQVDGPAHEVSVVCDAFLRQAESLGTWAEIPRPVGPRDPESDSPGHVALAAANHLAASWNFWIRSARKVTRPSDPPPAVLPESVLEAIGVHGPVQIIGEA